MTRWMHPPELERSRDRNRFDPLVEGERYGLKPELSLAIWKRVCDDASDEKGRVVDAQARQRFHEIASRIAARGGRLVPDVGRQTRVNVELGGETSVASARRIDALTRRVPGRTTMVEAEAQRWQSAGFAVVPGRTTLVEAEAQRWQSAGLTIEAGATVEDSPAASDAQVMRSGLPGAEDVMSALTALQLPTESLEMDSRANRQLFDVDLISGTWLHGERDRDAGKLPAAMLSRMERAYDQRFDDVEFHVDSSEVPAGHEAFTRGRHIHFEPGSFDPESEHGEHVVAHELAHVVQQSRSSLGVGPVSRSALEADAHQATINALAGRAAMVHLAAPSTAALGFSRGEPRHPRTPSQPAARTMRGGPAPRPTASPTGRPATSSHPSGGRRTPSPPSTAAAPHASASRTRPPGRPDSVIPTGAVPAGAGARGPGNDGLLMREAPSALTPTAVARLHAVSAGNHGVAGAITALPTAEQQTAVARNAVVEPQAEQAAHAQHSVVAGVDDRPPPSPEIEAACARIREVIRARRPPSEDRLVDARPREMAQQAGEQMSAGVERRADTVRQSYADMQQHPQGRPSRAPVPATLPPARAETPSVDAGAGAPDPLQHQDVSLDRDVAAQQQRVQDSGMNTEPGRLVNDGPIGDARGGVSELQTMSQTNPQQVLAQQAAAVTRAQTDMRALHATAVQAMAHARSGTVAQIATHTSGVRASEEQQRAAAGAQMQAIFTRTQSSVDRLLRPLSGAAVARWEAGVAQLSSAFESALAEVRHRIDARHQGDGSVLGEIGAGLTSLGDQVFGLPDWVVRDYDRAEAAFANGATSLITDISRDVNAVIEDCRQLIARARTDIDAIVHSLPASLQSWAQGEATRLGHELDQLGRQVDQSQQGLNQDLVNRANTAVQQVREQVASLREQARGLVGQIADAITAFLENPGRAIIDGLLRLVGIPPTNFWALIDRLGNVIDGIAADPMRFANTLMAGVGQGFQQFFHNLPTHLGQALFQWLFSKLGEAGVTIPSDFSLRSILGLVLDVLGISWNRIRTILARHIGERNAQLLDQAYQIISTLIERGPQGLIDMFVEQLNPATIVDMIKEAALRYLMEAIVTRVTARILMMLNPAGAILQAIEAIYRVARWVIDNAARIFTLIESIVTGAEQILAGNTSGVANLVENSLVRLIVPVIDFLAGYLGLGGIPNAIRDLILGLQQRVERIMDRVIGFVIDRARALWNAMRNGGTGASNAPRSEQQQRLDQAVRDLRPQISALLETQPSKSQVRAQLASWKAQHNLTDLRMEEHGERVRFVAKVNPEDEVISATDAGAALYRVKQEASLAVQARLEQTESRDDLRRDFETQRSRGQPIELPTAVRQVGFAGVFQGGNVGTGQARIGSGSSGRNVSFTQITGNAIQVRGIGTSQDILAKLRAGAARQGMTEQQLIEQINIYSHTGTLDPRIRRDPELWSTIASELFRQHAVEPARISAHLADRSGALERGSAPGGTIADLETPADIARIRGVQHGAVAGHRTADEILRRSESGEDPIRPGTIRERTGRRVLEASEEEAQQLDGKLVSDRTTLRSFLIERIRRRVLG